MMSTMNSSFKIYLKLVAGCVTFLAVLSAGIISKGAIFLMTSRMGEEIAQLSSGRDIQQHVKGIACWIWALSFSFAVPELLVFIQSLSVCLSGLWKRPRFVKFFVVFVFESAQTIGMAFLVASVLPHLSVMHGVLISNCVHLLPAAFNFLSRKADRPFKRLMDAFSNLAQLSGCLHWILIPHSNSSQRPISWMLPVSLILISCGWWENHVNGDAPFGFIRYFGRIKEEMKQTRPFSHAIICVWKILLFSGTIFTLALVAQQAHLVTLDSVFDSFFLIIGQGFNQFCNSFMSVQWTSPFYIFIVQATSSFLFYEFGAFACLIGFKRTCFALPVVLTTPVIILALSFSEIANILDAGRRIESPINEESHQQSFACLVALSFFWYLSKTWITSHIWNETSVSSEKSSECVSDTKWYNSLLIDQQSISSLSSTRNHDKVNDSTQCTAVSAVFAVATMWHETSDEMLTLLKSIFRMDKDQSLRRSASYYNTKIIDPHFYHYETHIFFDDAFELQSKDGATTSRVVNRFVNQLIELMANDSHQSAPPSICVTPYGGRLEWTLPGNTKMTVHLKDKEKIRIKKRWSQVMYFDYLMQYEIMGNHFDLETTYLLTLDGDMDFRPKAVHILVDMMNSQRDLAIACNRSRPTGSPGSMVWYQMFEYAAGFWLLKPCESVLGNILCGAGCFALVRATVLLDGEIMSKFAERSHKAHHFIQRDQGEDRWLCTLLIKRGYRIGYSGASSYAYTRCPETFDEFYNQRRRWTLSMILNTLDLLWNCRQTVKVNPNISWIYITFQALLLAMGILCPGSIFLVLVNTSATTFLLDKWISLIIHSALIFSFIITCFVAPSTIQLRVAKYLSAFYGLIVASVIIHSVISLTGFGFGIEMTSFSLNSVAFLLFVASCVFLAGCLHPREIHYLLAGPIYLFLTPSMSILLGFYSIINMNIVSWGTRDSNSSETTLGIENPINQLPTEMKLENQTSFQEIFSSTMDNNNKTTVEKPRPSSAASSNWNLEAESLLSEQKNVKHLTEDESTFWKDFIQSKLFPFVGNQQEEKDRISSDLIKLRNFSFVIFFLLNSIFVATIFGFQMTSEIAPESNHLNELTLSERSWLSETNAAQLTVVFVASSLLFIQFAALLSFRLNELIRLLSSTRLPFRIKKQLSHPSKSTIPNRQVVRLLSYRPTVHNNEDSTRNHQDSCQISTNSWI